MIQTLQLIESKLDEISCHKLELQSLMEEILLTKKDAVSRDLQDVAKILWCYETVVSIHIKYIYVFELLNVCQFYDSWCELEKTEIFISGLRKHFDFTGDKCRLLFIDKAVKNLQILFPYRLFASHESVYREKKCSICMKIISIRNPCGHKVGEIYNGEMCGRVVTKADLLAISFVENPFHKYAVAFLKQGEESKLVDNYKYYVLKGFLQYINSPVDEWDLEITNLILPHEQFNSFKPQDYCPCGSSKTYEDCCLCNEGVNHTRYSIICYS